MIWYLKTFTSLFFWKELEIIGKSSFKSTDLKSISIPDHVKIIDDYAFSSCFSLAEIKFTDNSELEIIGTNAFANIPTPHLSIPKTVKTIRNFAFILNPYCINAEITIEFPSDSMLENIGQGSFVNNEIKSLVVPKHIKEIKKNTFQYSQLENITFEEDSELEIIQNCNFTDKLVSINFPSQLKELGNNWARSTEGLVNIAISPKNQHFKYLDDKIIVYKSNDQYDTIIFKRDSE